jgi:predicted tellurium resistance membrane protein TerC
MSQLFTLLQLSLSVTLLDVDNALYMTSAVDQLPPDQKKKAIRLGLLIEFLARLVMVLVFGFIASGTDVLFEIFGIEFTAETISLLAAGIFLFVRTTRELINFLIGKDEDQPAAEDIQRKSFSRVIIEMSVVNAVYL